MNEYDWDLIVLVLEWTAVIVTVAAMVVHERRRKRRGPPPTLRYPPLGCDVVLWLVSRISFLAAPALLD
jgi:hypothetical protein